MGTWGVGPFEHDGAGDLIASLADPIRKLIRAADLDARVPIVVKVRGKRRKIAGHRAEYYYQDARTAVQLVLYANGTDILGGTDVDLLLQALEIIRADVTWCKSWKNPRTFTNQLDREIEQVKAAKNSRRLTSHERLFRSVKPRPRRRRKGKRKTFKKTFKATSKP